MFNLISREEAKELGLPRFFTGRTCKYGHLAERYTVNKDCVKCAAEKKKTRVSAEQRAQYNEARRVRYAENPKVREERARANREWRKVHGPEVAAKLRLRRETDAEWREEQNARLRGRSQRHVQLKHHYNLTTDQYAAMVADQAGCCAICQQSSSRTLHVDHCHATGKIRALLCSRCNAALGSMRDNPDLLRAAADYLEKHLAPE